MELVVGHLFECWLDRERRMTWVVEGEVAALLEIGIAVSYYPTFLVLAAVVELAVVHHSAVTTISVVRSVLASQRLAVLAQRRFAKWIEIH